MQGKPHGISFDGKRFVPDLDRSFIHRIVIIHGDQVNSVTVSIITIFASEGGAGQADRHRCTTIAPATVFATQIPPPQACRQKYC